MAAVGEASEVAALRGPRTEVLETAGKSLIVPGFVDAHLHFVALARRAAELDVSVETCATVPDVLERVRGTAAGRPAGTWVLGFGWDESFLRERRAPELAELDRVAPSHPVRLLHRTGHAALLNGAALRALGSLDHPGLVRDRAGRPTGLLLEPGEALRGRIPRLDETVLEDLLAAASRRLLAAGVVAFHDPTPGQGPAELERYRRLLTNGRVRQRVRLYGGSGLTSAEDDAVRSSAGPRPGQGASLVSDETGRARLRVAGRKVMVPVDPDPETVAAEVFEADASGWPVAIHAVEGGALVAALEALGRLGTFRVKRRRHRIEHASLCPPPLVTRLAESGATIVTHPDFLFRFGGRYRAEIPPEQQPWLYPLRSFLDAGASVAFGSDGPIAPPVPLAAIASAVLRRTGDGEPIAAAGALSPLEALEAHTVAAAAAAGDDGALRTGAPGDAVVLGADPAATPPGDIVSIPVQATIVAGEVAWTA